MDRCEQLAECSIEVPDIVETLLDQDLRQLRGLRTGVSESHHPRVEVIHWQPTVILRLDDLPHRNITRPRQAAVRELGRTSSIKPGGGVIPLKDVTNPVRFDHHRAYQSSPTWRPQLVTFDVCKA